MNLTPVAAFYHPVTLVPVCWKMPLSLERLGILPGPLDPASLTGASVSEKMRGISGVLEATNGHSQAGWRWCFVKHQCSARICSTFLSLN